MMQVVGSSELYFDRDKISIAKLKAHLDNEFIKYDILSHEENNTDNKVSLKFIMNMKEIAHCKTLNDYQSYIFNHFALKLPSHVGTSYVIAYKMNLIDETIKHIKDHEKVQKYINDLLG
ncbi:hypothetical protein [Virgibacillus sp. SK37]|uniref:hypothetical protein n=1 Tax=Virgibacillus sp. SK37 TaxID=403957 RepID=UPI0004D10C49|nr:hypothetical protein [Virgibacillus sp. SK37]AIF45420.1 hypothetical protein X953_10090 [Virgibacillus sp. SK37]